MTERKNIWDEPIQEQVRNALALLSNLSTVRSLLTPDERREYEIDALGEVERTLQTIYDNERYLRTMQHIAEVIGTGPNLDMEEHHAAELAVEIFHRLKREGALR